MPKKKLREQTGAAQLPPLPLYPAFPKTDVVIGLLLLLLLALVFRFSDLDLDVARLAYSATDPHWPGQSTAPWIWFYRFGQAPADFAGSLGLAAFIISFFAPSRRHWRGPGLYLFLMLLLGPGLIANVLGKGLAGRPRPAEILEFGGPWQFLHAFELGIPGKGKAFISGHASTAFYWFSFFFLIQDRRRWIALTLTLVFGALMGWARISQGGHFLSDVLLCGAAMFCLAASLSPIIYWQPKAEFFNRGEIRWALALTTLGWLLIANPIYEERNLHWIANPSQAMTTLSTDRVYDWTAQNPGLTDASAINLKLELANGDIRVDFDGENQAHGQLPLVLQEHFQASALPGCKEHFEPEIMLSSPAWPMQPSELGVSLIQRIPLLSWDVQGLVQAHLPSEKPCEARLKSGQGGITIGTLPKGSQVLVYGNFNAQALPFGFQAFGRSGYHKSGPGPLIVLRLEAQDIRFNQ